MSSKTSRPLRTTVMVLVATLVCLTWVTASRDLLRWWGVYRVANEMVTVNGQVDAILQAGQNLAFERGRTNVMLNAPDKAGRENLEFIAAKRRAIAETLDREIDNPKEYKNPLVRHILEEYDEIRELRPIIDDAFAKVKSDRPGNLAIQWFSTTTDLIDDLEELATTMSLMNKSFTIEFRTNSRMKILAFELRNTLGIESSRIAAAISAGTKLTQSEREYLQNLRGQGTTIWNALRRESRIADNQSIAGGVLKIDRNFFTDFRPLQNEALEQLKPDGEISMRAADLTAASVPALDSIADFLKILTVEADRDTRTYHDESRDAFIISLLLMALALAAGAVAIFVTIVRLFIPLQRIGALLQKLAQGDYDVDMRPPRFRDEMRRSYSALMAFRDSLLEKQKLEVKLLALSNSDGLTGLANRRCLDDTLQAEWMRAMRIGEPIALAMFDVDYFKKYNDQYGHLAGDECLKAIARILGARARRPGDLATRFGGEEFVVILPGLTSDKGAAWANEVRQEVMKAGIPHTGSPTECVTISAGVVSLVPTRDSSILEILRLADEALYRAKAEGRNRIATG